MGRLVKAIALLAGLGVLAVLVAKSAEGLRGQRPVEIKMVLVKANGSEKVLRSKSLVSAVPAE